MKYLSKILVILSLFAVLGNSSNAQDEEQIVIETDLVLVYLHNGSVIQGVLLENGDPIVLDVKGQKLNIPLPLVRKVEVYRQDIKRFKKTSKIRVNSQYHLTKSGKFYHSTHFGIIIGNSNWEPMSPTIRIMNGYQWKSNLALGLGIGLDKYNNRLIIPLFAEAKADLLPSKSISPLVFGGIGQSLLLNKVPKTENFRENAGLYWQAGFGLRAALGQKTSFMVSVGQQRQAYKTRWYWPDNEWGSNAWEEVTHQVFRRIFVRIGLIF